LCRAAPLFLLRYRFGVVYRNRNTDRVARLYSCRMGQILVILASFWWLIALPYAVAFVLDDV